MRRFWIKVLFCSVMVLSASVEAGLLALKQELDARIANGEKIIIFIVNMSTGQIPEFVDFRQKAYDIANLLRHYSRSDAVDYARIGISDEDKHKTVSQLFDLIQWKNEDALFRQYTSVMDVSKIGNDPEDIIDAKDEMAVLLYDIEDRIAAHGTSTLVLVGDIDDAEAQVAVDKLKALNKKILVDPELNTYRARTPRERKQAEQLSRQRWDEQASHSDGRLEVVSSDKQYFSICEGHPG